MKRFFTILFCSLFLLATASPLLIMLLGEKKSISMHENRRLEPWPDFDWDFAGIKDFPQQFEKYFNDHFGLRDSLVTLYDGIFVALFHSSPKNHVIIGKDKWLFLSTPYLIINDFLGLNQFDETRLRYWKQILLDRQEWLADKGIPYLFIPPPTKMMIYPEFLPDRIVRHQGRTSLDQFVERLNSTPVFTGLIDLRQPLLEAKNKYQVYLKTDTHWNFDGSYVAYREIMARLLNWFPEMHPIPKESMDVEEIELSGDISRMLNLTSMFKEKSTILHIPHEKDIIHFQDSEGCSLPVASDLSSRTGKQFINENPGQQKTAIVIADSFSRALRSYLCAHFRRIIFVKDTRLEDLTRLIEKERPAVVIDINVARARYVSMGENKEITEYILHKHNLRNTLLDIGPGQIQAAAKKIIHASITKIDGQEALQTSVQDPQLIFDLGQGVCQNVLNIHCKIVSPSDTILKVYFLHEGETNYREGRTVSAHLHKGENSVFMRLYDPARLDSIRLDPGETPGRYLLEHFSISEEYGENSRQQDVSANHTLQLLKTISHR